MTGNVLGKPYDDALRALAQREGITVKETAAPSRSGSASPREGTLHVVRVTKGEWVVAPFPVGLPRKE
ncbi:MAG: hypothetical protein IJO67_00700 [Clostridia bacterium]|nr:hypothetical protein [Clostridia bacterium]